MIICPKGDKKIIMTDIYGIPNCDTVKKAIGWLKENKIPFTFHDYKKEGAIKQS